MWAAAIIAAVAVYDRMHVPGPVIGYTEDRSIELWQAEPGIVRDVFVQLHQYVEPGQILVAMDDEVERIQLSGIQKDIERLQAAVGAEQARLAADNARALSDEEVMERRFLLDRETAHVDYLNTLVDEAFDRMQLRGAEVEYGIVTGLYSQEDVSFREFNAAETLYVSLQSKLEAHKQVIERAKEKFDEADRRWAEFSRRAGGEISTEVVLTPLRLATEVRERDLLETVRRIDIQVVRAPIRGQVTVLNAASGQRLAGGTMLAQIAPAASDRILTYLPEQSVLAARVGAPVSIQRTASIGGKKETYRGTVASLATVVSEAPARFWRLPNLPIWGRAMVVTLSDGASLLPGEAVTINLAATR